MRWAPDGYTESIASGGQVTPQLSAWLDGELLADWVPVSGGRLSVDAAGNVPERLTLTVPAVDVFQSRTRRWIPDRPDHPLEVYGQRLRLVMRRGPAGLAVGIGWYEISTWETDGYTVEVTCSGLLTRVDRAKLLTPFTPAGTCASVLPVVLGGILPVAIEGELADHSIGTAFAWTDDRLAAMYDVLEAWPAQARVDPDAVLQVLRPRTADDPADGTFIDGEQGTRIRTATGGDASGVYNAVHVTGTAAEGSDADPPSGWWTDQDTGSASRYGGPFGAAVAHVDNPLCLTVADCLAAARQVGAGSKQHLQPIQVDAVADWQVEAWDRRDVQLHDGTIVPGVMLGYDLPLTAADGAAGYLIGRL